MPKKSAMFRFTSLPDSMGSIFLNKETFSVDETEDIRDVKKRWGLVFYDVKSKPLDYYRLELKDPTAS